MTSNAARMETIRSRLTRDLMPAHIDITDESHKHAGHAGARSGKGHFDLTIVADAFVGKTLLERHRMVYASLGDAMQTDIHALSIKAYAPDEV